MHWSFQVINGQLDVLMLTLTLGLGNVDVLQGPQTWFQTTGLEAQYFANISVQP